MWLFAIHLMRYVGPSGDHTTGKGRYMYIEASSKNKYDKAVLTYEFPIPVNQGCFSMYYHMYGADMGGLNVSTYDGNSTKVLWYKYRNQGNQWHMAAMSIPPSTSKVHAVK